MANTAVTNVHGTGNAHGHIPFLQSLQQNGSKYTDFTIKKGGRSWKVHKVVIWTQSEYFQKACDGEYKEAHDNTITLSDDDDEGAISAMIHYLYHWEHKSDLSETAPPPVIQDIRLFLVADKYLITPLRKLALDNIDACFGAEWHNDVFPSAIREIYNLAPMHKDVLKPKVIETVTRFRELFPDQNGQYGAFQTLLVDLPDFAADAAMTIARSPLPKTGIVSISMFTCPTCGNNFCIPESSPSSWCCPFYATCNTHLTRHRNAYLSRAGWSNYQTRS